MSTTAWVVIGIAVVLVLGAIMLYNGLVTLRQRVNQAFADIVLEAPGHGGSVRAAAVTPVALTAGVLRISARARVPQPAPSLPDPFALGPPEPTSAEPFVATLGATMLLYGGAVAALARRRRLSRAGAPGRRRAGGAW